MPQDPRTLSRRAAMAGACGAACLAAVAGCAGYVGAQQQKPSASSSAAASRSGSAGGGGGVVARTSDIPVGGGKIFADRKVVITQPTQGTFKAFDTTCTHAGCTVNEVANGTIDCPCHGSKYDIKDASVVDGPAPAPLAPKNITVSNGSISLA